MLLGRGAAGRVLPCHVAAHAEGLCHTERGAPCPPRPMYTGDVGSAANFGLPRYCRKLLSSG